MSHMGRERGCTRPEYASDPAPINQEDGTQAATAKSVRLPPAWEIQVPRLRNYIWDGRICGQAPHSLRVPRNLARCHCLSRASDRGGSGKEGDMRPWPLALTRNSVCPAPSEPLISAGEHSISSHGFAKGSGQQRASKPSAVRFLVEPLMKTPPLVDR